MARARGGRGEDALSEIVGFVLILGLVVVGSTLYLLYVVPAEGREDEITHMNQVQERFVSYKTSVDGLWMRSLSEFSATGTRGVSLSTSFDLGTGGGNTQSSGIFLSFMRPIGTAAKMRTNQSERIGLSVDGNEQFPGNDGASGVPVGSLGYYTDNYYWIQQNYFYKLGGVFLEQPGEGVSVKVAPPIAIYGVRNGTGANANDAVKFSLSLVNITGEVSTVGGTGPLRVETRLRESMTEPYRNKKVENVTLNISCPSDPGHTWRSAWQRIFEDATRNGDMTPTGTNGISITSLVDASGYDVVQLRLEHSDAFPDSKEIYLDLTESTLQVTFEYDE